MKRGCRPPLGWWVEIKWGFWHGSTPVSYGRTIVQTPPKAQPIHLSVWVSLELGEILGNVVMFNNCLTGVIWTLGCTDCFESCLVKPGLFLALHHDEEQLWEEADVFWWCFVRKWSIFIERLLQSSTGWDVEQYGGKAQMLWRREKNSLWQEQTSRKCLKVTCDWALKSFKWTFGLMFTHEG